MKFKSVMQADPNVCFYCVRYGATETHHVMNGALRSKSEKDGFIVRLHHDCHMYIHEHPDAAVDLKRKAQEIYEKTHTREQWIERYRKSYL